ncbi:hypothetical protein FH972_027012 [Carpinus fangiana]|uniref:Uncharacterized protein n=1 Tax=Carpinus fangiana TaxID=176857 RepID=A0A5N6L5R2_9ROSI|nr:hypothetical protein FH972_027012 [Carpinus fangiana]
MEFLSAVVTKIAELLIAPISQWLCYLFEYDNNIKTMENKQQKLLLTKCSVQNSVDSARRGGEEIEALVTTWLKMADETTEEARKIVPVEERAFEKVSYCLAPQGEVSRRQMDYMDFDSRMPTARGLLEALGDANTNVIGVWGMAGAGKTTLVTTNIPGILQLVRELARQAKDKKLFDEVAIAHVTHSPDPRRIQGEIADMLDLKLDAETERGRAVRLMHILSGHKKTLVILDDIWKKLDLEEIGIPRTEYCKVILKSRDKNLLSCEMGTQKDFGLGELPESEAWNLFQMMVGDCVKDSNLRYCPHASDRCHMHDVVRDVATFIASRDHNMLVLRDNGGLKKWPDVDALKRCTTFSIQGGDIHELPNDMECPDLRFLCVSSDQSLQIPETFFKGMGKLQVLNLTEMKLLSLSSSLSFLGKLQTLCLEIGLLTHLRLLNLSNCSKLEVIPPNVLSSLVELEELYMGSSFVQWEIEGPNSERNNASLAELKHLSQLITLEIEITDVRNLPKDLSFEKLERYAISIGDHVWDSSNKHEASKALKLKLNTSFQLEVGIKMLLERVEDLYLDELKGVKSLLIREGFQQVKHLHIQNNLEIKYITNSRMPHVAFPALETFLLKNMTSLEEICRGQLPVTLSFRNLRIVKVEQCNKLKFIFSSSMAGNLDQQLQELEHLPKLMGFLITQNPFITDAGEIILEEKLHFHMPILHEQVVFPILESLIMSSVNLVEMEQNQHPERSSCILRNSQATSRFGNLSHLKVQGIGNIKYMLPFSIARFMVQLKYLDVSECEVMEEILVVEELGVKDEITPEVLFPRLERLCLKDLPILKRFCFRSNIEFPSLKELEIKNCPKVETFVSKPLGSDMTINKELRGMSAEETPLFVKQPFFNEEVVFPILERLELSSVNLLEIEQNQHPERSSCILRNSQATSRFENLSDLEVQGIGNIKYILPFSIARFMVQLKHLHVIKCEVMEEILVVDEFGVKDEITPEVLFP